MDSTPMPEPLRQAVHQLVGEAVSNCQEVLQYTEPGFAHDWKRMTLIAPRMPPTRWHGVHADRRVPQRVEELSALDMCWS
ncbi:hypothetical protein ACFY7C_37065 [Streptomyces sp. NPDC012769]|uniref:hypothetical protein n=1 Tax=Streptomyces sp. NPDC012769 TaxID=3364848 RepID=UPI0036BAB3F6